MAMTIPLHRLVPALPTRHPLGRFPSPLEHHPALARQLGLSHLAIKRDDLNGTPYGGNKLRGLEFLLPTLRASVVSFGGYGSTWCAALSVYAGMRGCKAFPALFAQPWSPTVAGLLATTVGHGEPALASTKLGLPHALARSWWRARRFGRPSWLPAGGATPLAVLGTVNAALECVEQLEAAGSGRPDAVIVPCGSGATAAGLVLGFGLARWPVTVCAVRVSEPWYATAGRVLSLARRSARLLRRCGLEGAVELAPLRLVSDQLGAGYGHPTPAAVRLQGLMAAAQIPLDVTYSAKAAAALSGLGSSFPRQLFWHTFDVRLVHQPAPDHPLLRRAHLHAESLWPQPKST